MGISKRIIIHNDLDIAVARLQARDVAREIGFGTVDQARISLAAGELARVLSKSMGGNGEIIISGTNNGGHIGIQVVSSSPKHTNNSNSHQNHSITSPTNTQQDMSSALSLVDEYIVEDQGNQGTRVTLMKWLS